MRRFVVVLALLATVATGCDDGGGEEPDGAFRVGAVCGLADAERVVHAVGQCRALADPARGSRAGPVDPRGARRRPASRGGGRRARDTPLFTDPLGIVRRTAPVDGDFVVVDMRYFTGPESPPSDKGYILEIDRWYIKLYVESDWSYQGRFIVEQRTFGRGVAAAAPYDTKGFRSPDWTGFQWDSADTTAREYPGLPGQWSGIPYDFVQGGAGLEIAGLPDEVRGCLQGT